MAVGQKGHKGELKRVEMLSSSVAIRTLIINDKGQSADSADGASVSAGCG